MATKSKPLNKEDYKPVAVITGAAKRIGGSIAQQLHQAGFTIAVHYRHSRDSAEELAERLNGQRENSCHLFQADLDQPGETARLGESLLEAFDGIDVLVNNASGFEATPLDTCTENQFDAMLGSNLKAPYFLVQALLPGLKRAQGCVINIIDVHVERPLPGFNAYGAAKAGLASLTRSLAVELGPDIRVNGIAPGAILWPEGDDAYNEATRLATVEATPLKRMGEPGDIARTVEFLACNAPFITGQVLTVDGGRSLV